MRGIVYFDFFETFRKQVNHYWGGCADFGPKTRFFEKNNSFLPPAYDFPVFINV